MENIVGGLNVRYSVADEESASYTFHRERSILGVDHAIG
jgi:hypothetical protein